MARLVEFWERDGCRVAVNPALVTSVLEYKSGNVDIYLQDSSGACEVKATFDEVVAALTAEPETKVPRLVRLRGVAGTGPIDLDPSLVQTIEGAGTKGETLIGVPGYGWYIVEGSPDEVARALGLTGRGEVGRDG